MNLPFPEVGKNDKETINNLYDTVLKLRKELMHTLMHLDGDNIPGLNQIVTDTAGNAAQLLIQAGQISSIVTDVAGNASLITQQADVIQSVVSSVSTLDGVVSNHTSSITQQAGQIQSIVSSVSEIDGIVSNHTSSITQLSNQISLKVSSDDFTASVIVGMINGSSVVKIDADRIDLTGITTIYESGSTNSFFRVYSGALAKMVYNGNSVLELYVDAIAGFDIDTTKEFFRFNKTIYTPDLYVNNIRIDGIARFG